MVFALALFGMLCWGLAPIFAKVGLVGVNPLAGLVIRTYIAAGILSSYFFLNNSLTQIKQIPMQSWFLIALESLLATLVGDLAYYAALKRGDVSFVTIVMSCSPLVSILTAVIFLNETITVAKCLGTTLIMIGLVLIVK